MKQRFLLAACILIGTAGSVFWALFAVTRAEEYTVREIVRLGGVQVAVQQVAVQSYELIAAKNSVERHATQQALLDLADRMDREANTIFEPHDLAMRYLYARRADVGWQQSYEDARAGLTKLAGAARDLAAADQDVTITASIEAIRAQTQGDLSVRLQGLTDWHDATMQEAISLLRLLHIMSWPLIVLTLAGIWFFLIAPLLRIQLADQQRLRRRRAEAVKLAERAKAASLAKSSFLATMSHEIRTPMNGVLGVAQALRSQVTDPEHQRMVTWLQESGESLLQLLNDILDFSKIEAGKLEIEVIDFQPEDLVRKVEALHMMRASEHANSFTVRTIGPTGQMHRGDPHRILQVLHNLVSNAIKFTHRGRVEVTVEADGKGTLYLMVSDTGVGMTPDQLDRVFEEFSQAEDSISRRFGGTGLGMAIVNRLVRLMDGRITLDSTPGRGTTVHVSLPLVMGLPSKPKITPNTGPTQDWSDLRVLAADDVETNRVVLDMLLREFQIGATFVSGGRDAIEAARCQPYDLMLLDISMPEIDGLEALRAIRQIESETGRKPCPAIAITANALTHQIEEFMARGFDGYVAKPIKQEHLQAEMRRCVVTGPRRSSQVA
ncbi:MAG: ATP-binding protein [Pseudomonadota bacterium]